MKRILVAFVISISSLNFATAEIIGFEITGTFGTSTTLNGVPLGADRTFTAIGNIDNTTSESTSPASAQLGIFKPLSLTINIANVGAFDWLGGSDPLRLNVFDGGCDKACCLLIHLIVPNHGALVQLCGMSDPILTKTYQLPERRWRAPWWV